MGSVTIEGFNSERLTKHLAAIARRIGRGGSVSVGFIGAAKYPVTENQPDPPYVATVAFWNEFGATRAPARPFMRNTIEALTPEFPKILGTIAIQSNYRAQKILTLLGEGIKDRFALAIQLWPADNAPSTVLKKGFNKGLVDTALMSRSLTYKVET